MLSSYAPDQMMVLPKLKPAMDRYGNVPQEIDSAVTSLKQVARTFKQFPGAFAAGSRNLDLGGGKYDIATDELASEGVSNLVFDPFNRSMKHNLEVVDALGIECPFEELPVIQRRAVRACLAQGRPVTLSEAFPTAEGASS